MTDQQGDQQQQDEYDFSVKEQPQFAPIPPNTGDPLPVKAQVALDKSDVTIIRCAAKNIPVPAEWGVYRDQLRAIATYKDTTSTALPTTPAYVPGT